MTREAQRDAAKRRKTPTIFQGVDLEAEAWRYCKLLGFQRNVELQVKHSAKRGSHGRQWLMVTQLTIGYDESLAEVLEILLHEVCHVVHSDHSEDFIALLVRMAEEVWDIDTTGWQDVPQGRHLCRAYAVDDFLTQRLKKKFLGSAAVGL